jgi:hypothetical protein
VENEIESAIRDFSKTLIPNICSLLELTGNDKLIDTVKRSIYDRRDSYLNSLNERKRHDKENVTREYNKV